MPYGFESKATILARKESLRTSKRKLLKGKYLSPKGERLIIGASKKEKSIIWEKYGKKRYVNAD